MSGFAGLGQPQVEPMAPPGGSRGDGLHWFRVEFRDRSGRCFITTGEAQHLRQLTVDWVRRALRNHAAQRGWDWLEQTTCGSPGLMLHHDDACDSWLVGREARSRRS